MSLMAGWPKRCGLQPAEEGRRRIASNSRPGGWSSAIRLFRRYSYTPSWVIRRRGTLGQSSPPPRAPHLPDPQQCIVGHRPQALWSASQPAVQREREALLQRTRTSGVSHLQRARMHAQRANGGQIRRLDTCGLFAGRRSSGDKSTSNDGALIQPTVLRTRPRSVPLHASTADISRLSRSASHARRRFAERRPVRWWPGGRPSSLPHNTMGT